MNGLPTKEKKCVPKASIPPENAQSATRILNPFIMLCYIVSLLTGFGVFGLMACIRSKETIGLFLIWPCTSLHTSSLMIQNLSSLLFGQSGIIEIEPFMKVNVLPP